MIVVRVELHSAITKKVTEIGRAVIFNKGDGTERRGNYKTLTFRKGSTKSILRTGDVEDYPRMSKSVWCLVARALAAMDYK